MEQTFLYELHIMRAIIILITCFNSNDSFLSTGSWNIGTRML